MPATWVVAMTAKLVCAECGAEVVPTEPSAGQAASCPHCFAPLEPAAPAPIVTPPHSPIPEQERHEWRPVRVALKLEMLMTLCAIVLWFVLYQRPPESPAPGSYFTGAGLILLKFILLVNWWIMAVIVRFRAAEAPGGWLHAAAIGSALSGVGAGLMLCCGAFTAPNAPVPLWPLLVIAAAVSAELLYVLYLRAVALRLGDTSLAQHVIIYFAAACVGAGAAMALGFVEKAVATTDSAAASFEGLSRFVGMMIGFGALCGRMIVLHRVWKELGRALEWRRPQASEPQSDMARPHDPVAPDTTKPFNH